MTVSRNPGDSRYQRGYPERYHDRYAGGHREVDAGRLWTGGVAAALVSGLTTLVGVLVVSGLFNVDLLTPARVDTWGDAMTAGLVAAAAAGALVATGLLHLLLLTVPEAVLFLRWIVLICSGSRTVALENLALRQQLVL